ncbi:helix-turn-helix domain-containing protein [Paenibacillus sp. BK720]|uniref:helix-turn-helix domain-containing protein n=1 Tax=Paenibacillus sp. BK720 TaxID=2587092 RepID=UPI00142066DA|nr:helix-turn-helix domain-containing protein [Paenibacillus sp. BK720]NIK67208.1 AraC-like DNA-binding protein/ActR/RegA family two-component response regulator [Paenibacillus sp. BK720]
MYNILLVDDEPWSLLSLKNSFPWDKYDCRIAGETHNPFEALELLRSNDYHAAFVDIRMPGMTGLEIIQTAKQLQLHTEFIITSGYADFSYAQEAIRNGVFDYMLKPINSSETDPLLAKLKEHLEKKRRAEDEQRYESVVRGEGNFEELFRMPSGKEPLPFWYAMEERGGIAQGGVAEDCNRWSFNLGTTTTVRVVNGSQPPELAVSAAAGRYLGISSVSEQIEQLPRLVKEARMAQYGRFVQPEQSVFAYRSAKYPLVLELADQLETALSCGQDSLLVSLFGKLPEHFKSQSLGMEEVLFLVSNIRTLLLRYRSDNGIFPMFADFEDPEALFYHFADFTALCARLSDFFEPEREFAEPDKGSTVNESFLKLLHDVNQNFCSKLQLSELASRYHLNFTYCCDLFKKTTGKTFVQYVTDLRLQRAEKLLTQTDLTLDLITDKVGFSDTNYFSNVFKKHYQLTPAKYRKEAALKR